MIPNIIHYCWFGGNKKPALFEKCYKSWEKFCPGYQIIEWNEENFDRNSNPFVQTAYESQAWAFVSDYARLKIVYENGGIYLDTDVELLKNLDFLRENGCFIGVQQARHLCTTGLGFGAVKSNSVVKQMLEQYEDLIFDETVKEGIVCPYLNNRVMEKMGYSYSENVERIGDTLVLPPRYLDPVAPGNTQKDLLCEESISIHHYMASWTPFRERVKRKLFLTIGQRNVNKVKKYIRK